MEAILYICHGSRIKEAANQAMQFIQSFMQKRTEKIQEYGFLELAEPTIEEAYEACIRRGATKIKVIPVLLLTAAHAKQDIPMVLNKLETKSPEVQVKYGSPIGINTFSRNELEKPISTLQDH